MKQKTIKIGDVVVPVIEDEGKEWFPVSYITKKILLRKQKNSLVGAHNRNKHDKHLRKYVIKFGESNIQESTCIEKDGLTRILLKSQVGRLTADQRIAQNHLHQYLNITILPIDEEDSDLFKNEWLVEHDDFTKEIIINELSTMTATMVRRCSKCYNHFPLTSRFYALDERASKGHVKICHVCTGRDEFFKHFDAEKNKIRKVSLELINAMNENSIEKIYDAYLDGKLKRLPECYHNKESYERIIKYLHNKGDINKNNLTYTLLIKVYKLIHLSNYFNIDEIYQMLYGEKFYLHIWEYPKYAFRNIKLTYDIANEIVNEYLETHEIKIENVFDYDYYHLFNACKLRTIINDDIQYFVVQYYDFKYPSYMFNIKSKNYYKIEENLLFDLRYLIEEDMKLQAEKIPLYLTKNNLQKKCLPLYHYIVTKKNKSIFEWVNILYPNKFIEADFEINPYRNEFDSDDEMYIHEILEKEFPKKVIYNQRNNGEIRLKSKIPDWFIFTDHGVWVVEYFGMLEKRKTDNNRLEHYRDRYEDKLNLYSELNGYKFLYLYREDITDDFKGCREKIRKVKENVDMSMV